MTTVQEDKNTDDSYFVDNMYKEWFLEYASYVILDRAIPEMEDGLKPVQRRILHAMYELEDGRYNKAANIIGNTMRFHPHGDMAISEALVKIAQKNLLIDTQGNWGNPATGDDAAAPRYIEARLTKFAEETVFNPNTTEWQASYDGRHKEPVSLPIKFPILLFQGVEGIAVGLSTKIVPYNFCELVKESIAVLKGFKPQLLPDFPSGGSADFSAYQDGKKGSKIKVRAKIEIVNSRLIKITEVPFGLTTTGLIESILASNDKGKIKIKKIEDNTAKDVEVLVHLPQGVSVDTAIQALYAFTDCEISISPLACVIADGKPWFCGVSELLIKSTERTKALIKTELEFEKKKVSEKLHQVLLEKIFIENRIYRKIESAETWEKVIDTITKSLKPFVTGLYREVTAEDIEKLTEIKIKRISKYDELKADEQITDLKEKLAEIEKNLQGLVDYCVSFFKGLLQRYGQLYPRKTRIETFGDIKPQALSFTKHKMYVSRKEGFIGTSLKKDDFAFECTDNDEWIAFSEEGFYMIGKPEEKVFVGKDIIAEGLYKRNDERCIYHVIYRDGKDGPVIAKRFHVTSLIRNKQYSMTKENPNSKVLYFSINPSGESEKVRISFKDKAKNMVLDFSTLPIRERQAAGLMVSQSKVDKIIQVERGASTLAAQRVWFDKTTSKLNTEGNGSYLGKFVGGEKLLALYQTGSFELFDFDLTHHFTDELLEVIKFDKDLILTAVYFDGEKEDTFVKRVSIDDSFSDGRYDYVERRSDTKIWLATFKKNPVVEAEFSGSKKEKATQEQLSLKDIVDVKGIKALGNKLSAKKVKSMKLVV